MDISREEQRVLHALAKGGHLEVERTSSGRIVSAGLVTREGWTMPGLAPHLVRKLKRKRSIASNGGGPYRITRRGLELVRSQPDNR